MLDVADLEPDRVRPLRRAEYDRLVESGAFDDERLELLEGTLVTMTLQNAAHAHTVQRLAEELVLALRHRAVVRSHSPLALSEYSEPEPDIAVVPAADYSSQHPSTALFIAEVSGWSLRRDRRVKAPMYARAGIPEYWVIDLQARTVDVHRGPTGMGFTSVTSHRDDETLSLFGFLDVRIALASIMPRVP